MIAIVLMISKVMMMMIMGEDDDDDDDEDLPMPLSVALLCALHSKKFPLSLQRRKPRLFFLPKPSI